MFATMALVASTPAAGKTTPDQIPEAAMLWYHANHDPAATLPMADCHAEANEPAATPAAVNPKKESIFSPSDWPFLIRLLPKRPQM